MARRSDHTREELKELAIQAGWELISQEGFARFSARKVAARIGYTVGTLYNAFGTHDNLILHINAYTLDHWYGWLEAKLKRSKGDPIRALAKGYIAFAREHSHAWRALFEHHLPEGATVPDWYVLKTARFFSLVEKSLLPQLRGNRKKAKRAAQVLWAGVHGICVLSLGGTLGTVGAESAEKLIDSFLDNYLTGVARG